MLLWIVLIVLILCLIIYTYHLNNFWKEKKVKYIKSWPLLGSFTKALLRRTSIFDEINEIYFKYPDEKCIGLHQVNKPILMLRDPELIKDVTVKHFDNFINHTSFIKEDVEPLFGKSLMLLSGERWKKMRATLSPAFTGSKMRAMYLLIKECAEEFPEHFMEAEKQNGIVHVEMKDIFTKYANDVIATTAFGIKCDSLKNDKNEFYLMGKKLVLNGLNVLIKIMGHFLIPKVMTYFKISIFDKVVTDFFKDIVQNTIETREKEGIIRPDVIHLLMEAKKGKLKHEKEEDVGFATAEESEIGKEEINKLPLTNEDIAAQAMLFFFAGFDTSSNVMSFLSHELAVNPEIQQKLQKEIDETLKKCDGNIDYESLLKMRYLDMVLCEGLRYWPPGPVTDRNVEHDYILTNGENSLQLEKGQTVWIPIYGIHHDPKYYSNPERFDPERFNEENRKSIRPFTYMPFGAGPRNCIGSRFALLEIKILFVQLLSKFDIVVTEKTQIPLKMAKGVYGMQTEKGFKLGLKPRY